MIQDKMIDEIQELKLAGYTLSETYDALKLRHTKVPTLKTVRKYYNMDSVPADNHASMKKSMAFDCEPFRSAIIKIADLNPNCRVSSIYDVLVETFVEKGNFDTLPGNEQTLRNFVRHLRKTEQIGEQEKSRRTYDVLDVPPPGEKAQVDFGQIRCEGGLVVHFMCILLWHSRLDRKSVV